MTFDKKTFSFFSLSLSSLCVFYSTGRSHCIKSQNKFFLVFLLSVEALLEAVPKEFSFGAFNFFFS
jgi:hypothetical protein